MVEKSKGPGATRPFEHRAQVAGERRFDHQSHARVGVINLDAYAMEEGAVEAVLFLEEAVRRRMTVPIVAEHGMTDGGEVATDLVGSALLRDDSQDTVAACYREPSIPGPRWVQVPIFSQIPGDRALRRCHASRSRDVDFSRERRVHRFLPLGDEFGALGEHHQATRADINPM
jgi:hypothetical protein